VIGIKFQGLSDTVFEFNEYNVKTEERVKAQLIESGNNIAVGAKSRVPRDTGKLHGDIRVLKDKLKDFTVKVTYMGKGRAFYGKFVEFGTFRQPSKPFIGPAADEELPNFEAGMAKAIEG